MNFRVRHANEGRKLVHSNERYEKATNNLTAVLVDLLCCAENNGEDFSAALNQAKMLILSQGEKHES